MKKQETPFEWPFQEYTLKNGVSSNRGISEEAKSQVAKKTEKVAKKGVAPNVVGSLNKSVRERVQVVKKALSSRKHDGEAAQGVDGPAKTLC
jgi:hypothetical protein